MVASFNTYIRVDALERLFADELLNSVLNSRDSGRTANHKHLDLTLTRAKFDELTSDLVEATFLRITGMVRLVT